MNARLRLLFALFGILSAVGGVSAAPPEVIAVPSGANLLQPLSNAQKWQLQTLGSAKARVTRETGTLTVTTTAVDGTDYHVQLYYLNPKLQEGAAYTLSLRAKADAPRKMHVYALIRGGDYHGIGLWNDAEVGTEFKTFTYTFVVKDVGQAVPLCPQFPFGNAPGSVTLSDVSLTPADPNAGAWSLVSVDPGKATLVDDGATKTVTITSAGTEDWHVQLNQSLPSLKDGKPYVVSFRAKSDAPRDLLVSGQVNSGDYHGVVDEQYAPLGTDWKPFTFTFTPHDVAGRGVYFPQILLGKKTGTVYIDAVTVKPEAPDPVADPAAYAPKVGELRAEGVIQAAGFGPDGFTLLVSRLVRPGGGVTPLSPARAKPVRLTADTQFRSLADGSQLYLATLKPGDTVSIIGPDLGVGKSLPARLMLR